MIIRNPTNIYDKINIGNKNDSKRVLLSNDFGIGVGLWILGGGLGLGLGLGLFWVGMRWYEKRKAFRGMQEMLEEGRNPLLHSPMEAWYNSMIIMSFLKPKEEITFPEEVAGKLSGTPISHHLQEVALFYDYTKYLSNIDHGVLFKNLEAIAPGVPPRRLREIFTHEQCADFVYNYKEILQTYDEDDSAYAAAYLKAAPLAVGSGFHKYHKTIAPLVLIPGKLPVGQKQKVLETLKKNITNGNEKYNFVETFFRDNPGEQIVECRKATNEVLKDLYHKYWIAPIQKKYPDFNLDDFMGHVVRKYHKLYFDNYSPDKEMRKKFFDGLRNTNMDEQDKYDYIFFGHRFILFSLYVEEKKLHVDLNYRFETVTNLFPRGIGSKIFQNEVITYISEREGPRSEAEISRIRADFFDKHPNKARFQMELVISLDSFVNTPRETFETLASVYGDPALYIYQSNTLVQKLNDLASPNVYFFEDLPEIRVTGTSRKGGVPLLKKDLLPEIGSDVDIRKALEIATDSGIREFCSLLAERL